MRHITDDHCRQALEVLGLAGETINNARYDPYFGPLVMLTSRVIPFVTRIDDLWYQSREKSEIVMHDGDKPEWITGWEECYSPVIARNAHRFIPRKTGQGFTYHRRKFTIPNALYIITERFDAVDRIFLCDNNPYFNWTLALEGLHEYCMLNRMHVPPPAT